MRTLVSKKVVAPFPIYDITVKDVHHFALANGVVAHNCLYPKDIMSGGCMVAGTQIQLADGTLINIEDVQEGQLVATLSGPKAVGATWNPDTLEEGTPECFEITFEDGHNVTVSAAHKFLVDGQWVEAQHLTAFIEVTGVEGVNQITSIKAVGKRPVYDISVEDVEHYILANGVVTHNTGGMYSANQVFIIGKSQEKEGTEVVGWNFTLNVEKSRFVKEKSKLSFLVTYQGGIDKYSGLLDEAMELGFVASPTKGWYQLVDQETGEIVGPKTRSKDTGTKEFLGQVLNNPDFCKRIREKYRLATGTLVTETIDQLTDNIVEDDIPTINQLED